MKKLFSFLFWLAAVSTQAQNNPIFTGGGGSGWSTGNFTQATNNIFQGGEGDGWAVASYLQPPNNIFSGSNGDGWTFSAFLQTGNDIFGGSDGDGWNYNNFLQAGNSIFAGGQGDGWASTYRALGVLPATLVTFTAEKNGAVSVLRWQTSTEINTSVFDIERSNDAIQFTKIGTVAAAGNSTSLKNYQFTDAQPLPGTNYYRLKQIDRNGAFVYTPTRMLLFDAVTLLKLKIYPIPATALLTIELPQQAQNENVVLNLSNALGVMVKQVKVYRNTSNRQVLDLSILPAGVYTLQVATNHYNATQMVIKQ